MNTRTLRRSPGPRKRTIVAPIPGVKRWHVNLGVFCGAVGALVIVAGLVWIVVKAVEVMG